MCPCHAAGAIVAVWNNVTGDRPAVGESRIVLGAAVAVPSGVTGRAGAGASCDQGAFGEVCVTIAVLGVVARNFDAVRVQVVILSALIAVLSGVAS